MLRTFIERIIIHERTTKHSKTATQQIDIYFRYIGKRAFGSCEKLFSIELGRGVREISDNAFADCDAIVEVVNKSSLDIKTGSEDHGSIALYAVSVTRGISNIKNVGDYYFHLTDDKNTLVAYTGSDSELYLPDCPGGGEYEIGNRVFKSRDDITSVHIPDGVTAIGTEAFRECNGLKSMILPDSVKLISERAFLGCDFISFYMGDGVVSIGKMAFRGCGKLESICYKGSKAEWENISIDYNNGLFGEVQIIYNYK